MSTNKPPKPLPSSAHPVASDAVPSAQASAAPSAAPSAVSDDELLDAVHALMHAVRGRLQASGREDASALTPLEGRVLGYFAHHPGATLRDLVAHSGRDKGQLARLLSSLRERGLLLAEPDADDRRTVRLRLAPAAQAHHQRLRASRQQLAARATQGLDAATRASVLAALQQMRRNLDEAD